MSFLITPLRIIGTVATAALAASGVGLPLAVGLGAGVSALGGIGADAIERGEENSKNNAEAARKKKEAEDQIAAKQREAEVKAKAAEAELQKQRDHAALPGKAFDACQSGDMQRFDALLKRMDKEQVRALGMNPVAHCSTAENRQRAAEILQNERSRRGI